MQCACAENLPTDDGNDDVSDQERDLQNFNNMVEKFEKTLKTKIESVLLSEYEVRDGKNSQLQSVLEQGANLQEPKALVALSDVGVQFLQQQFQRAFDETNREVAREYSNLYVNSFPGVFLNQETAVSVNLVQVGELQKIAGGEISSTLKMTRLKLRFAYELRYKILAPQKNTYQADFLLTNDLDFKNDIQNKLSNKVNDLLYPELLKFKEINEEMIKKSSLFAENLDDGFYLEYFGTLYENNIIFEDIKKILESKYDEFLINPTLLRDALTFLPLSFNLDYEFWHKLYNEPLPLKDMEEKWKTEVIPPLPYRKEQNFIFRTSKLSMKGIEIKGLPLNVYIMNSISKEVLVINFSLSREFIDKHLDRFISLIVGFFHYYQFNINGDEWFISVDEKLYNELIKKSISLAPFFETLNENFKKSDFIEENYNFSTKDFFIYVNYWNDWEIKFDTSKRSFIFPKHKWKFFASYMGKRNDTIAFNNVSKGKILKNNKI